MQNSVIGETSHELILKGKVKKTYHIGAGCVLVGGTEGGRRCNEPTATIAHEATIYSARN